MPPSSEPTRLDVLMNQRRREFRLRWRDVADRAGLSEETIRQLRKGSRDESVRATDTEPRVEDALRWRRGSIQRIRDGLDPLPLPESEPAAEPQAQPARTYPDWVPDDELCRYIFDGPGPEWERRAAIQSVVMYRELENRREEEAREA